MPYGLPGSNPRMAPGQGNPPQGYGSPQGQVYGDPRLAQGSRPVPPPGGSRYTEKAPSAGARQVPLRVEKITDKSLQSRMIYGNLYVVKLKSTMFESSLT